MIFKNHKRDQRNQDEEYVLGIFQYFEEQCSEVKNCVLNESKQKIDSIEDLISCMSDWSQLLDVKLKFMGYEESDEEAFNLPAVYIWEETEEGLNYYLTTFGKNNLHLAVCELILLLVNMYIEFHNNITIPEDFYEQEETLLRPFVVFLAIYMGYGQLLINRSFVECDYQDEHEIVTYHYYVPLKNEFMFLMFKFVNG